MITSRKDPNIQKLLNDFLDASDYFTFYTSEYVKGNVGYDKILVDYVNGPLLGKIREKDSLTLQTLKNGVTDEVLKNEIQLYFSFEIDKLNSSVTPEELKVIKTNINEYINAELSLKRDISEFMSLSLNEKRVYIFLDYAYKNYSTEIDSKFNNDLSRLNQSLKNILIQEHQFTKYGLVHVNDNRELIVLNPPRLFDKTTNTTYYTKNISLNLLSKINRLKEEGFIKDLSVRLKNSPGLPEKNMFFILTEELERGQYLDLSNLDKIPVTKLYSKNINDNLWIVIDNQNITFEEICDDFNIYNDMITTQVVHLEYFKENNEYFIKHLDHEYIFYTEDEYNSRQTNSNQKGTAKPRLKSFKIDNARIPLNCMIKVKRRAEDNYSLITQQEPFLYYVLDSYFEHKDLLNEYFQKLK